MRWILLFSLFIFATPTIAKPSHFVYNITADKPVSGSQIPDVRPIASLTKLMTAIVVLKNRQDLTEQVTYRGHHLPGSKQTKKALLEAMLVRSDNQAAEALAESWPGGRKKFIEQMNIEAKGFSMTATKFVDPSGLLKGNQSSAGEYALLMVQANKYDLIKKFSTTRQIDFEKRIGKRVRIISIPNTNRKLLFEFDNIIISKTGWTVPAGRCLAMVVEKNKELYAVVILGEPTVESRETTARNLIYNIQIHEYDHAYQNNPMGH